MKSPVSLRTRLRHSYLPTLSLLTLLQRSPAVQWATAVWQSALNSPIGVVLKSSAAIAASLGTVNSLVGATPLVPSTGAANGVTVNVGTNVSIAFTVSPTQTPIQSWKVTGSIPPGMNFSGLTSAGSVDIGSLALQGAPTTAGTYTASLQAFDQSGNRGFASAIYGYTVTVNGGAAAQPAITTQPQSQAANTGGNITLTAAASGTPAPTYQWHQNGVDIAGATGPALTINNLQPGHAGLYTVTATNSAGAVTSSPAVVGVLTAEKVAGFGELLATDIPHPNGNHYDQVLMTGAAVTVTATAPRVTRTSYIDLNDDIVQVEFAGPGSLTILLDAASPGARPVNYTQAVDYVKGHATLVIAGATENTNVSVFTVGRATAFDPNNHYDITKPVSATNNPANNSSPIFEGHQNTNYDGIADIELVAIASSNGKFGGIRTSNATYSSGSGTTGIFAPGVNFQGPIFIGNLSGLNSASAVILLGTATDTRITGGSLAQGNGQAVTVSGITQLKFTAGLDSAGRSLPAQQNRAVLRQNGQDVTQQIVVNPAP